MVLRDEEDNFDTTTFNSNVDEEIFAGDGYGRSGLIQALYLVGSVALDDFPPESSDVDFVTVLAERADTASLQALGEKRPFAGT